MRFLPIASLLFGLCAAEYDTWPYQTFKSSSLEPPNLKITKSGPTSPGYLFFDQSWSAHQYGVFIMSDDNELVWQSPRGDLHDFRMQTLDGKPVLTFWNGLGVPEPFGWGYGLIQILDQNYESIYNVTVTDDNYQALGSINSTGFYSWLDMHEGTITADGTMLATGYNVTRADLSAVGGPRNGWVADSLFYEIDIKTNEILYRWSALDHIDEITLEAVQEFYPIKDWGKNYSAPYGYFHINSVDKFADGSYLISSRYYSSLFRIATDGSVDWTLQVHLLLHLTIPVLIHCPGQKRRRLHPCPQSPLHVPARCAHPARSQRPHSNQHLRQRQLRRAQRHAPHRGSLPRREHAQSGSPRRTPARRPQRRDLLHLPGQPAAPAQRPQHHGLRLEPKDQGVQRQRHLRADRAVRAR